MYKKKEPLSGALCTGCLSNVLGLIAENEALLFAVFMHDY